jgi:V/A-type H+-transporting ATPase subunit I
MIAVMDRVEIVCLRSILEELTNYLHQKGLVQIEEVPLAMEAAPGLLRRVHLTPEQKSASSELDEIDRALKETLPLLSSHATFTETQDAIRKNASVPQNEQAARIRQLAQDIRTMTRRKLNLHDSLDVLRNYQQLLQTLEPLLGGREVCFGRDARALVLKGDVVRAVDRLSERLNALVGQNEYEFIQRKVSRGMLVGVLKYGESKNDSVTRVLREQGIEPVDMPEKEPGSTTPRAILDRIAKSIARDESDLADVNVGIDSFSAQHRAELAAHAKIVGDRLREVRVVGDFAQTKMLGVIHGWVSQDEMANLKADLEKKFAGNVAVSTLSRDDVPVEQIPTLLKNPTWLKPFEVLLSLYKPPTYGTLDPTLLVAVTFILYYGFILGDVGYGLVVMAFAWWLRKKWGHNEVVRSASTVGYCMGVSGIIFGVLYAEYFGNLFEHWFGLHPIWLHREHEADTLMLYAIAMGAIHVPLSLILGIREDFRHHHPKHAMEKIALMLGLCGVGIAAFRNFDMAPFNTTPFLILMILLLVSFVGIMFKVAGAMGAILILEIVSLVGNVLSFCRLMALGIAGVVLANLANLAGESLNPLLGIPLAAAIHVFNIGLGMFSPTLHSLRLNYVESLPKFYSPFGKSFNPFRKEATW